jgi:hypothetical protein
MSSGSIKTEDGKKINFDMSFKISKEQYEKIEVDFKAGDALTDPLALNIDGSGIKLSEKEFEFDIDSDGHNETIHFLTKGSGFLVLDKNKNGIIDNGSELFGPRTNNGFTELNEYDEDNNNWIDENDLIYYDLSLWTKDEDGSDIITKLKDAEIGAIYLNDVNTKFSMDNGQLKSSGIYLTENGNVGLVQEVDLLIS